MLDPDKTFMLEALKQAQSAAKADEVPIGAVITHKNKIIAKAHNQVEMLKDPTAHAEMIAITQATSMLGTKWLDGCCLYVTIEPCSMCAGALVLARIKRICFAAADPKTGACGSVFNIARSNKLNHNIEIKKGTLEQECGELVSLFFKEKRKKESSRKQYMPPSLN
ncbi:MAG: tRNA-specific adenosine deaminase [Omnitrophica WOR_2 bacterium GWA2_47_8]|nr:MAG: tRNA-specific adenosine deaminase [Omnitrophica WOR_2 bacterium GWA2_47_8]